MDLFKQLETQMWQCAHARDSVGFSQLVAADAVMVCGGYRCSGAEYAAIVSEFDIDSYSISEFELVLSDQDSAQVHYIIRVNSSKAPDLAGLFHVTSTWRRFNTEWKLIFNMDSRIK